MEKKMDRIERAKQFMPFAALHGYEETVHNKERKKTLRRELTSEETDELNAVILKIAKGNIVTAKFYSLDGYSEIEGVVSEIDTVNRFIRIVKTKIRFDDLYKLRIVR